MRDVDDLIEEYLAAPEEGPEASALRRLIHRAVGEARGDALIQRAAEEAGLIDSREARG